MAPRKNKPISKEKLIVDGINLQRSISTLESIDDLSALRQNYISWRELIKNYLTQGQKLSVIKQAPFFESDRVINDIATRGLGLSLKHMQARGVINNIMIEISKKLKFLYGLENEQKMNVKTIYDHKEKVLTVEDIKITITDRGYSHAASLLEVIFKNKKKEWATDEILEKWGERIDERIPKNRVYQAGKSVNEKVSMKTRIKDFLIITTKSVKLNNKYT